MTDISFLIRDDYEESPKKQQRSERRPLKDVQNHNIIRSPVSKHDTRQIEGESLTNDSKHRYGNENNPIITPKKRRLASEHDREGEIWPFSSEKKSLRASPRLQNEMDDQSASKIAAGRPTIMSSPPPKMRPLGLGLGLSLGMDGGGRIGSASKQINANPPRSHSKRKKEYDIQENDDGLALLTKNGEDRIDKENIVYIDKSFTQKKNISDSENTEKVAISFSVATAQHEIETEKASNTNKGIDMKITGLQDDVSDVKYSLSKDGEKISRENSLLDNISVKLQNLSPPSRRVEEDLSINISSMNINNNDQFKSEKKGDDLLRRPLRSVEAVPMKNLAAAFSHLHTSEQSRDAAILTDTSVLNIPSISTNIDIMDIAGSQMNDFSESDSVTTSLNPSINNSSPSPLPVPGVCYEDILRDVERLKVQNELQSSQNSHFPYSSSKAPIPFLSSPFHSSASLGNREKNSLKGNLFESIKPHSYSVVDISTALPSQQQRDKLDSGHQFQIPSQQGSQYQQRQHQYPQHSQKERQQQYPHTHQHQGQQYYNQKRHEQEQRPYQQQDHEYRQHQQLQALYEKANTSYPIDRETYPTSFYSNQDQQDTFVTTFPSPSPASSSSASTSHSPVQASMKVSSPSPPPPSPSPLRQNHQSHSPVDLDPSEPPTQPPQQQLPPDNLAQPQQTYPQDQPQPPLRSGQGQSPMPMQRPTLEESEEDLDYVAFHLAIATARKASVKVLLRQKRAGEQGVGAGLSEVQQKVVMFREGEVDFLSAGTVLRRGEVLSPLGVRGHSPTVITSNATNQITFDATFSSTDFSHSVASGGAVGLVSKVSGATTESLYLSTRIPLSELSAYQDKLLGWRGKYKTKELTSSSFPSYSSHQKQQGQGQGGAKGAMAVAVAAGGEADIEGEVKGEYGVPVPVHGCSNSETTSENLPPSSRNIPRPQQ